MIRPYANGRKCPTLLAAIAALITPLLLAGCMRYTPQPLDAEKLLQESSLKHHLGTRAPAGGEVITLGLDDLHDLVLRANPDLRVARADARVTAWMERHAGKMDDPEIEFSVLRLLESADNPWTFGTGVSFAIPLSGRLEAARQLARAETARDIQALAEEENTVLADMTEAHLLYSRAALLLLKSAELESRHPGWSLPDGEVRELATETREQKERIRVMLGLAPGDEFALEPSLELAPVSVPPSFEAFVEQSLPLQRARRDYEVSEATVRLAVREQYPDINLGPLFELDEGSGRLGLGLSLPIPMFGHGRAAVQEAMLLRDVALMEFSAELNAALRDHAMLREDETPSENGLALPQIGDPPPPGANPADVYQTHEEAVNRALDQAMLQVERARFLGFPTHQPANPKDLTGEES